MVIHFLEKSIDCYFGCLPRKTPSKQRCQNVFVTAHRGAHHNVGGIFENTLEAFYLAQNAGCWGLEFDVHVTKDNVLVVNHDPTLTRLWGIHASISELTFEELRSLAPRVPSLHEVVREFGHKMHLFIELKTGVPDQRLLVKELVTLEPCQDYHLITLDPKWFNGINEIPKEAQLLVAVHNNMAGFCNLSMKEGFGGVLGSYVLFTKKRMRALEEAHQKYGVGFIDTKYGLFRELHRGISWIFTNRAEKVMHFLRQLT